LFSIVLYAILSTLALMENTTKKIVIKIGSNVLTQTNGLLDLQRMESLVAQVAALRQAGRQVVLVSSGAVAAGRGIVQLPDKAEAIAKRQVWAAVGQVQLMQVYSRLFAQHQITCSQVLVTKEDFRDRQHYINMKNCFTALWQHDVLPIVNENDVVAVTELMFTDNDELAGLIAAMLDVDTLCILTNVEGIYTGNPAESTSRLLTEISPSMDLSKYIVAQKSNFGRGGMLTKANIARKVAKLGIGVHLANGKKENILTNLLLQQAAIGTYFHPTKKADKIKKWLAYTDGFAKASVVVNEGAKTALLSDKAYSLLPVGIVKIEGEFEKGDIIKIIDTQQQVIGLGMAQYSAAKATEKIGQKQQKPLVHYDYLFLV